MSCIRVEKVIDHIADPLMRACDDSDPYVRKTAAIAIAKLFDANPELVESRGSVCCCTIHASIHPSMTMEMASLS